MTDKSKTDKKKYDFIKVIGTPTMMLLPARNYKFKVYEEDYRIELPRKGAYEELDPDHFSKEDGSFNFLQYDKSKKYHTFYLPSVSKALFAAGKYPDLKDGQAFTPIGIVIRKDKIEIIGSIIEMIEEN